MYLESSTQTLEQALEAIKQRGHYAVSLYYGEGVGWDDIDIPQSERYLQIVATPVGCLGGVRVLWTGNLSILRSYDFSTAVPVEISNPPKREEYKEPGFYIWGEDAQDVINRRYSNEDL